MTDAIDQVIIHVDGGARGNPGPAGAGVVIANPDGTPLHEAGYFLGHATNNVAEYTGLLRALEVATTMNVKRVAVHSDSQLMVKQLNGEYRVKSPDLKPLYQQAAKLLDGFVASTITHVYRDKNQRADQLANLAMDAESDRIVNGWPQ
ncbi:MAG: ribonuclease HI family protein [Planctomycetota bacterium]